MLTRAGLAGAAGRLRDHRSLPAGRGLGRTRRRPRRARAARRRPTLPRLAELAAKARAALLAAPVPDPVARAVAAGYARLGADVPVAVRSSATAEDLPFASFAGQQDTYLNVVGRGCRDRRGAALLGVAVDRPRRRVPRHQRHRSSHRAPCRRHPAHGRRGSRRRAVHGQPGDRTADARRSSTPAPASARRSSPARSTPITSSSTPRPGEILERRLGDKRLVIRSQLGGGTEHVEQASRRNAACLTDDQIRALAALGDRVEAHYGAPQDTEWAIDGGGALWLTQARPITTLFPLPASRAAARRRTCASTSASASRRDSTGRSRRWDSPAFRLLASAASELLGFPVADPLDGPEPVRRGRPACLRRRHGRPARARSAGR